MPTTRSQTRNSPVDRDLSNIMAESPNGSDADSGRVPPYIASNPALWFVQLETYFAVSRCTDDETQFRLVIRNVTGDVLLTVRDLASNPPATGKYDTIKKRILDSFGESQEIQLRRLLQKQELGNDKPSVLLRKLRALVGENCPEHLLRSFFFERLPEKVRTALAASVNTDLAALAEQADRIYEQCDVLSYRSLLCGVSANAQMPRVSDMLAAQLNDLCARASLLPDRLPPPCGRSNSRGRGFRHKTSQSRARAPSKDGLCFVHQTVPQSVWNELPANLKKEVAVDLSYDIKAHHAQRPNYYSSP